MSTYQDQTTTLREWCSHHDLIPALLPFGHRSYRPLEFVGELREAIRGLPKTAATFRFDRIKDDLSTDITAVHAPDVLTTLAGAWHHDLMAENRSRRWVNPHYIHVRQTPPNITDTDRRLEVLRRLASFGTFTHKKIGPRFGITEGAVRKFVDRNPLEWSKRRQEGVERMARTVCTASEWSNTSIAENARALGVHRNTLTRWVRNHARRAEFTVPDDPSSQPWFRISRPES